LQIHTGDKRFDSQLGSGKMVEFATSVGKTQHLKDSYLKKGIIFLIILNDRGGKDSQ